MTCGTAGTYQIPGLGGGVVLEAVGGRSQTPGSAGSILLLSQGWKLDDE